MIVSKLLKPLFNPRLGVRAMSEHRTFPITPSRWQWARFKDLVGFYTLLGVIPCTLIVIGTNVFIGPATLSEVPEDYEPKYWEYYRHPITRWIARYILNNPQQDYEKYLSYIYIENERRLMRKAEAEIKSKIKERKDYQMYYYRPISAKHYRFVKEMSDQIDNLKGD